MKKNSLYSVFLLSIAVFMAAGSFSTARAMVPLLDGRLKVSGFLKETCYYQIQPWDRSEKKSHIGSNLDTRVDFLMTSFFIEGMYTISEGLDHNIQFYSGFKWWWEKSGIIDDNQNRHINHRDRKDYKHPRSFDKDILTEAYLDIEKGPWQFRIGKQIVIWGQLDTNRVADVVNPLDLRWGVPGLDTWEEVKKGLWMIRGFYTSDLPGQLVFEFIFNPGYFRSQYLAYQGTHWGPKAFKGRTSFTRDKEMGFWPWLYEKNYRDAPTWNLSENYEWGFRLHGYTWGIDWTLLYWNHRLDWGIASVHDGNMDTFAMQYVSAGIRAAMTGSHLNPGDWPDYRVFKFKRYQTIGGTAQTYVPWLHLSTWDFEWFYEIGSPFNKGTDSNDRALYDEVRRDVLGLAIKYNDRFKLPAVLENLLQTNKNIDFSITYFWEKIFNHDHDIIASNRNHLPGDSVTDGIALWAKAELFNTNIAVVPVFQWLFRTKRWYCVLPVTYYFPRPYHNFRATVGLKLYGAKRNNPNGNSWDRRDSLIFRLEYQF